MKRGYKRLLIFEVRIVVILILNSFVWNILSTYKISIFLLLVMTLFKFLFGFEKNRRRYLKDLVIEVVIFLIEFLILYYLLGIIITFYESGDYYTKSGFTNILIPTFIYLVLREYSRYMFMCKAEGSRLLFWTTTTLFVMFDITTAIYFRDFSTNYSTFLFIALTFLPAVSTNIVLCYFSRKTGYLPLLIYSVVIGLYPYLMPIVPNPNQYVASIVNFMLPILFGLRLWLFYRKEHKRDITVEVSRKKKSFIPVLSSAFIVLILVYFISGYFHYWAIAVASSSMAPKINKGDVVIIEKIDNNYDSLKKGQVIAFKYDGAVIVHRLVNIVRDGNEYYFYTKGDANNHDDKFYLKKNMIIGKVDHKIPYIGIPTVWVNEL